MDAAKSPLAVIPSKAERQKVADTLKNVAEQDFDEVVILGFKDGKSYLHHSKIANEMLILGAIESLKYRLMQ